MNNKDIIKAIENLDSLGYSVLSINVWRDEVMYERQDGTPCSGYKISDFINLED